MGILSDKIYKGLVEQKRKEDQEYRKKPRRSTGLTASSLPPVACRRANWFRIKGRETEEAQEFDPLVLSKFRDGNDTHELLRYLFADVGVKVIGDEFGVTFKGIYARVDYKIQIDGVQHNLEFKTGNEDSFYTFLRYGIEAFPGYYSQCQVIAGSQPKVPLIFMMKNKNSSDYEDEIVEPNIEYQNNLAKINEEFTKFLATDVPPERDFGYGSPSCAGCEYRYKCWHSHIRADTLLPRDFSSPELEAIRILYKKREDLKKSFEDYCDVDRELKDFIAFMHTKHSASKVRLGYITSSLVVTNREFPDLDYIRSVLTDKERETAFYKRKNEFFRTLIK